MNRGRRRGHSGDNSWHRGRRSTLVQNLLHLGSVSLTQLILVVLREGCVPQHDTTEPFVVNVSLDDRLDIARLKVRSTVSSTLSRRETNEQLGIRVSTDANGTSPDENIKAIQVASTARFGIVELDPDEVKGGRVDGSAELGIGESTLGGSGDVELLGRVLGIVLTEAVDHRAVL